MTKAAIVQTLIDCFDAGNKVIICGCGGLAAESLHFVGELVGKYKHIRKPLPAIALGTNIALVTAVSNDFSFNDVYSRELEALAKPGDILIVMSTSGKSEALLAAVHKADELGISTIDWPRNVGTDTPSIQNEQVTLMHAVCEEVEKAYL